MVLVGLTVLPEVDCEPPRTGSCMGDQGGGEGGGGVRGEGGGGEGGGGHFWGVVPGIGTPSWPPTHRARGGGRPGGGVVRAAKDTA